MAEVHIVDIDGEQWDMKDQPLTTRVAALETDVSENTENIFNLQSKTTGIFHAIAEMILANGQEGNMIIPVGYSFILYSQYEVAGLNASMYQIGRFNNTTESIYMNPIVTASPITVTVIDTNHIKIKVAEGYGRVLFRLFQLS